MSSRLSYALMVIVLLVAAALRTWNLTTLPVGMSDEELAQIVLIEDYTKQGDIRVFYETDDGGQEGLYNNFLGLLTFATGSGTLSYRIFSVWVSLITIAFIYSLGMRLIGRTGALAAGSLFAVLFVPALLARLVLTEAILPLLVAASLLALARALPVYRRRRVETKTTIDFTALGIVLGVSLYVHPSSLLLVLGAMFFIIFIIATQRPLTLRQISSIGFAILMTIIMAMPYFISTIRLPQLAANQRLLGDASNIFRAYSDGLIGVALRGDAGAMLNVSGRPLVDLVTGFFVLLGFAICLRHWLQPRYALLLIIFALLTPVALLTGQTPDFLAQSLLLPFLALFFGIGIAAIIANLQPNMRRLGLLSLFVLLSTNLLWTMRDLFVVWPQQSAVETLYNADLGRLVHHLDVTSGTTPTTVCYPQWKRVRTLAAERNRAEWILLLMNRDDAPLRFFDCRSSFVFANGGTEQQVVFPQPLIRQILPPIIDDWIDAGETLQALPDDSVVLLDVETTLADALGLLTTTAPASYVNDADISDRVPVPPPIRFGGNLTWLGYAAPDHIPVYQRGNTLSVVTYWRVEGVIPPDAVIFTHILSDPVTIATNRDTIHVDPRTLQERDVFLHITTIPVPISLPRNRYEISIGVYQNSSNNRLPVFGNDSQPRGNRIFLYDIRVE